MTTTGATVAAKKPRAKKAEEALTASRLRELVSYDTETGDFRWLVNKSSNARVGQKVGSDHNAGYLCVRIDGVAYLLHRLAWLYVTAEWPTDQIDHADGQRTNNRFANLRECTNAQNCQNVRAHRDGSGLLGTTFDKQKGRWLAQIGVAGRHVFLGYFETQEAAHRAYLSAKPQHHEFSGGQYAQG